MEILGQFQSCSCASLAFGDPLIPSASGMINPEMLLESHSSTSQLKIVMSGPIYFIFFRKRYDRHDICLSLF